MMTRPAVVFVLSLPWALPIRAEDDRDALRGLALLEARGCTACHAAPPAWAELVAEAPARPALTLVSDLARERLEAVAGGAHPLGLRFDLAPGHMVALLGLPEGAPGPLDIHLEAGQVERGRQLFHHSGCVACHEPYEDSDTLPTALWDFPEPTTGISESDARGLSSRFHLGGLGRYLGRDGGAGHRPVLPLAADEAEALAAYLLFEEQVDAGGGFTEGPGVVYEYYEGEFDRRPDFTGLEPTRRGVLPTLALPEHRPEHFALRYTALLEIETAGKYTFAVTSDDGSWLSIDGRELVDNGGMHAPATVSGDVRLEPGRHALELVFFEYTGGEELTVTYEGPGITRRELPAERLSHLAARFRVPRETRQAPRLDQAGLSGAGCLACHASPAGLAPPAAPALLELDARAAGCLERPAQGARPGFALAGDDTAGLRAALASLARWGDVTPATLLTQRLHSEGCLACHRRDGQGGPPPERLPYFEVEGDFDLGDEGRLPPHLDDVGSKLRTPWLREVLGEGARSRPYVKTRMPRFPGREALIDLIGRVDHEPDDDVEPAFTLAAVEAGRRLVGTKGGLGCIQCHDLAGHPSLGIPAVDLAKVHDRVRPGWFRALLMDPIAINMNTRMPTFWVDGKSPAADLYDGDPARQVDAIWTYLSLEESMPLPVGLLPHATDYEVEVIERPVTVGVFFDDVSPRTLLVGFPERLHLAYDLQHSRLAKVWRGRFYNGRGTWHGRAGALEQPFGDDVLELPPGAAVARLATPQAPWPADTSTGGDYRVLGRRFDAERRPVFRYSVGGVVVEDGPAARLSVGGARLVRRLHLASDEPPAGIRLRLARGTTIEAGEDATFTVAGPGGYRVRVTGTGWDVVRVGAGFELRGSPEFVNRNGAFVAEVEAEYSW